jgi:hypothetical protein
MNLATNHRAIYRPIETLPDDSVCQGNQLAILPSRESRYALASRLAWLLEEYDSALEENRQEGLDIPTAEEVRIGKSIIRDLNEFAREQMSPQAVVDLHGHLQVTLRSHFASVYFTMRSKDDCEYQIFYLGRPNSPIKAPAFSMSQPYNPYEGIFASTTP